MYHGFSMFCLITAYSGIQHISVVLTIVTLLYHRIWNFSEVHLEYYVNTMVCIYST